MNTQNQINIEIPQSIIDGVMQKLQECKTDLAPYLLKLDADQSISFFKTGNKTATKIDKKTKSDQKRTPTPDSKYKIQIQTKVNH